MDKIRRLIISATLIITLSQFVCTFIIVVVTASLVNPKETHVTMIPDPLHGAVTIHDNQVYGMRRMFDIRHGIIITDSQAEMLLNELTYDVLTKLELADILGVRFDSNTEWLHILDNIHNYVDYMHETELPMSPDSKP